MPDNTYGFLRQLPDGLCVASSIQVCGCTGPPWCTTSMVPAAQNHCAAVMAANILLMLGCRPVRLERLAGEAYKAIGPGPIANGLRHSRQFMAHQGMNVRTVPCLTVHSLERALRENRPAALLVVGPRLRTDWHWVAAFGMILAEDGRTFFEIADGWHPETRFYPRTGASRRIFAGSFALC